MVLRRRWGRKTASCRLTFAIAIATDWLVAEVVGQRVGGAAGRPDGPVRRFRGRVGMAHRTTSGCRHRPQEGRARFPASSKATAALRTPRPASARLNTPPSDVSSLFLIRTDNRLGSPDR